ncbi:MAG: GAF domain-containing protein [Nitrospirae bacterium]|nr:GAF domain-containing protein [Nitrospirota bacterium]
MDNEKDGEILRKAEDFLKVFKKGEEFTHELLITNEKLRFRVVQLEEEVNQSRKNSTSQAETGKMAEMIRQLEKEKMDILNKYKDVEAENKDFASRYVEVEEENNNLANLYVASYQLHSTLDYQEVLRIVLEVLLNLVGADRCAILLREEESPDLTVVASEGLHQIEFKKVKMGEGIIGNVGKTGESHFVSDLKNIPMADPLYPIVCIPLKIKEHILGVIAVFSLLEQKKEKLNRIDYELFSMLAGHAATAIFSSRLYSQSERKLSTIHGFINLLSGREKS